MQKELAKKQNAISKTTTMTNSSHAIRLNKRGWSQAAGLRIEIR
jgi:hypothetical protein